MSGSRNIGQFGLAASVLIVLLGASWLPSHANEPSSEAKAAAAEKRAADAERRAAAAERKLRRLQRGRSATDEELERRHDQLLNQQLLRDSGRR